MGDFSAWVREQRTVKRMTQTECAIRAGMKLQQWNQIEGQVKLPRYNTVCAVALGLGMDEATALEAAGYLDRSPRDISPWALQLARDIDSRAKDLSLPKKEAIERAIDSILTAAV